MTETVDAPVADKASLFEDLIDIFVSPAKVYARRANSGFIVVTLIFAVLIGVLFLANQGAMQSIMDAEFNRQMATTMAQNPSLTPEAVEASRGMMETFTKFGVFLFIPIGVLILGLGIWLVGKMFGASMRLAAGLMIAAYAYAPRVLESALVAVQGIVLDTSAMTGRFQLSWGVGRFLDPDATSIGLLGILGRIDVFTIWMTILIGIGISVVGKVERSQGMLAAAVIWVLGALPAVFQLVRS